MLAFLAAYFFKHRKAIEAPRPAPEFDDAAWAHVLGAGERIALQTPVSEPEPWYVRLLTGQWWGRRAHRWRQLALTSGGALLLADRDWLGGLSGRERHEPPSVAVEDVKNEEEYGFSLRLRLGKRRCRLDGASREVAERLLSASGSVRAGERA